MLDLKYVLANFEAVIQNCRNRNVSNEILEDLAKITALAATRWMKLQSLEADRRRQNEIALAVRNETDPQTRSTLVAEGAELKRNVSRNDALLKEQEAILRDLLKRIPNLTHPDAPIGQTEDANKELRKVGTPRTFDFTPKDHVEIGKSLDLLDFEAGAKVSGNGFYFLKNDAVLLDMALHPSQGRNCG